MEETRKSFKTSEFKPQVHSQNEAWKRESMAASAEKKPYFPYGKLAQIGKISKLLLVLILTYGTAISIFIRTPGGRLNLLKFLCSWNALHKNNRIVYWNTSTREVMVVVIPQLLKKMGGYVMDGYISLFFFFSTSKKRNTGWSGGGVICVRRDVRKVGLVIIYDEAWCLGVDGSKKGQF